MCKHMINIGIYIMDICKCDFIVISCGFFSYIILKF